MVSLVHPRAKSILMGLNDLHECPKVRVSTSLQQCDYTLFITRHTREVQGSIACDVIFELWWFSVAQNASEMI